MTKRALAIAITISMLAGCGKLKSTFLGEKPPPPQAAEEPEEEEETLGDASSSDGGTCLLHPGYCRGRCRNFTTRRYSKHARRIVHSTGFALAKCGEIDVFAESDEKGGTIVEYYGSDGNLLGATDSRAERTCDAYGFVPPSCKPTLQWSDAGVNQRPSLRDY